MTYCPEVVHEDVENAQDEDQQNGAKLGLESDHNHDASHEANQRDHDSPQRPLAAPDEADEQEDQEDTSCKLEVHLAVLLVNRGQTSKSLSFPDPGVRQYHHKSTNNGQIAQEEVHVED